MRYKMEVVSPYMSIITLNVNGLNFPMKRHRMVGWIKKTRSNYMLLTKKSLQLKGHIEAQSEGDGKIYST